MMGRRRLARWAACAALAMAPAAAPTLTSAHAAATARAVPADACHVITRAEAHTALKAKVRLTRGEDATLCNILYGGRTTQDIIMAFKRNAPGRRSFASVRHALRTHTERDTLGGVGRFIQTPLRIPGTVGFEVELFHKPPDGPEDPTPDRQLVLLRHGRVMSMETAMPLRPPSFTALERLARFAIKRF